MGVSFACFRPSANFLASTSSLALSASTEARNFASTASSCARKTLEGSLRFTEEGARGGGACDRTTPISLSRMSLARQQGHSTAKVPEGFFAIPPVYAKSPFVHAFKLKSPRQAADDSLMRHSKTVITTPVPLRIEAEMISDTVTRAKSEIPPVIDQSDETRSTIGSEIDAFVESLTPETPPPAEGIDRRGRTRAKVDFRVHIRGGIGTIQAFEDVVHSIDVTRDGLLLSTGRSGYWVGEPLLVTFPFWNTPTAINKPRRATVIRSALMRNMNYGLAVKFDEKTFSDLDVPWVVTPFANQVRVLGVESDARMVRDMQELLERDGYQVVFVSNARQALDVLRYETPDVILAEAEGAEISGQDLCAIVKKSDRLQHIPVILLTNSAMPSDYSAIHRLGAIVCMMKPCQPGRLQRAVHLVAAPPAHRTIYSAGFNIARFVRTS
jgi:CheY-like chemotaxis protein